MKKHLLAIIIFFVAISFCSAQTPVFWGLAANGGQDTSGVVFKVTANGTLTAEYSFKNYYSPDSDGFSPYGSLYEANDGLLYGLTSNSAPENDGAIFSYNTTNNTEKVLNFISPYVGAEPTGSFIQATNGLLYATTTSEGAEDAGSVISYDIATGTVTDVYDFGDNNDGYDAEGSLLQASDGLLYGLTTSGGPNNGPSDGEIFSIDPTTNFYTSLYYFAGDDTDGGNPHGSLIQAKNGILYGMTEDGGSNFNYGTIFSYNITTGKETMLYAFDGSFNNGASPYGSLLQVGDTMLYGLTNGGDSNSFGTIFRFNTFTGQVTTLYSFPGNGQQGFFPEGSLIKASDGKLYGTTPAGGANDYGTIFSFDITTGTEAVVASFDGTNGSYPLGDLTELTPTGINQLSANTRQLTVYPNPTSSQFTVYSSHLSITTVELVNILGQTVYTATYQSASKQRTIPVTNLANGVYVLKVASGGVSQEKEVVIAK